MITIVKTCGVLLFSIILIGCGSINGKTTFFNKEKYRCTCESDDFDLSVISTKENGLIKQTLSFPNSENQSIYIEKEKSKIIMYSDSIKSEATILVDFDNKVLNSKQMTRFKFGSIFGGGYDYEGQDSLGISKFHYSGVTSSSKFISRTYFNQKNQLLYFDYYNGKTKYRCTP